MVVKDVEIVLALFSLPVYFQSYSGDSFARPTAGGSMRYEV
jgi:hypothetical protein